MGRPDRRQARAREPVGGGGAPRRAGRAGLRRPAAGRRAPRPRPAAGARRARPAPDRLRQRARRARTTCRCSPASGPTTATLLDRAAHYAPRRLFEYWGHEASLLPGGDAAAAALADGRAPRTRPGAGCAGSRRERPELLRARARRGARARARSAARELGDERPRRAGPWWDWSRRQARARVPVLERPGDVGAAARLRAPVRPAGARAAAGGDRDADAREPDAQRELLRIAARACGVAAERDLRDYFRLPLAEARQAVAELVEAGELLPVAVEGWSSPAYLDARRASRARSTPAPLIGPFDSLIWERSRTERLFGFRYRIEIYVPAPQRVHGYYVLPFLLGDRLVARVDLKADRQAGVLRVQAEHLEPDAPPETAAELESALEEMANWLGLDDSGRRLRDHPSDEQGDLRAVHVTRPGAAARDAAVGAVEEGHGPQHAAVPADRRAHRRPLRRGAGPDPPPRRREVRPAARDAGGVPRRRRRHRDRRLHGRHPQEPGVAAQRQGQPRT